MRILVVEPDPVSAALLEDRFTLAGYEVEVCLEGMEAVSLAEREGTDLMVVSSDLHRSSGLEVLRALRCQPETRALPVLLLGDDPSPAWRVEVLRAGADDYLVKPFDLEEVLLRSDRLIGARGSRQPVLQGDLDEHAFWEVIQYLVSGNRNGFLVTRSGRLQVEEGRVVAARYRDLEGREALLALASLKEGQFRFVGRQNGEGGSGGTPSTAGPPLQVSQVLMEAAWLSDELGRRGAHQPPTGAPLAVRAELPEPEGELEELPLEQVYRRVREGEGVRLYDLLNDEPLIAAPLKVRLAVAWLIEQGALGLRDAGPEQDYPNTMELSASLLLEVAARELIEKARAEGRVGSVIPYFVLASPGAWPALARLFGDEPLRPGSSIPLTAKNGRLSFHVQEIAPGFDRQLEAVTSVCAGVVIWVDRPEALDGLDRLIERVSTARGKQVGVLIAGAGGSLEEARKRVGGRPAWRLSGEAPRSLLGLLRLVGNP